MKRLTILFLTAFAVIESHPLFFDSLFPSFQSTTPETVVSDYRQRKRADSRAEHVAGHDDAPNIDETKASGENNVEFYAEVIGKLVGTIRDGVSSFIGELKQRRNPKPSESEMKTSTQRNQQIKPASSDVNITEIQQASNGSRMRNSNESEPASAQKISIDSEKNRQEIKPTMLTASRDEASESNENDGEETAEIQSKTEAARFAWNDVVQVIARRTKRKRSEESHKRIEADDDRMNVEQLGIPIDSVGDMTNERVTIVNGDGDDDGQEEIEITSDDPSWYERHQNLFSNLSANHRRRKEKLINFIHRLTKANALNNTTSNDTKLSFTIMRGNSTVVKLTPLQILRIFHRGSDEHAELQQKTKTSLQRAFYKYARLYLFARKGYKDARNFNREHLEHHQENDREHSTLEPLALEQAEEDESLNLIEEDDSESFAANSARLNLHAMEAFAILVIEIFGAILGLTLGAIGQIQATFVFDI